MIERTMSQMIQARARDAAERSGLFAFEDGRWHGLTWGEVGERVRYCGRCLIASGVERGALVGVHCPNCPQGVIIDYAIQSVGAITVPIYATDHKNVVHDVIHDSQLNILFVGRQQQFDIAQSLLDVCPNLKKLVVMDSGIRVQEDQRIMSMDAFLKQDDLALDAEFDKRLKEAKDSDVAVVFYSSTTTGHAHGVEITHEGIWHTLDALDQRYQFTAEDVELAYMPLAHIYGRMADYWSHSHGMATYYVEDPRDMHKHLNSVRPTFIIGTPFVYGKIREVMLRRLQKGIRAKMAKWALSTAEDYHLRRLRGQVVGRRLALAFRLADYMVLRHFRNALGGRLRVVSAGAAAVATDVERFFLAIHGTPLFVGYGQTETNVFSYNSMDAFSFGSVGKPNAYTEVRIEDDGELLVRSKHMMRGYLNNPELTGSFLTEDGWFKTGDLARLDQDGFLYIIGRKKDTISTSKGKHILPAPIERVLEENPLVRHALCVGHYRDYITALLVPSFGALKRTAIEAGLSDGKNDEMVSKPAVRELYQSLIDMVNQNLAHYARIKRFTLVPRPLSAELGEISVTAEPCRNVIMEHLSAEIEAMYQ